MARSRWDTVGELLERVRDMSPEQRELYLHEQNADEDVREEVRSLLHAEEGARYFFDDLAPALPSLVGEREPRDLIGTTRSDPLGLIGQRIRRYRVESHLGGGGMGIVYKAHDVELDRGVALKFLPPYLAESAEAEKRFLREARAASRLDHQNIATIYEIALTAEGSRFIAMAFYDGETLKETLLREGGLSIDQAVGYGLQIAEGLSVAHEAGIIHRDVKPANVLVTERGVLKLLDFGLARVADRSRLTQAGRRLGTIAYMSPEQARGSDVDERTDIWALGVVLYEMVTGVRPFDADHEMALLRAIQEDVPIPVRERCREVPVPLAELIGRCLRKDPTERPGSVDVMEAELRRVQETKKTEVATEIGSGYSVGSRWSREMSSRLIWMSALIVVLLGLGAGVYLLDWTTNWDFPGSDTQGARLGESTATPAMVVLPCTEAGEPSSGSAFCTGLMASLTDRLVDLQRSLDVWVVPAREVQRRGATTPAEAQDWYNADLVLMGSVAREPDRVRVRLRLFHGERQDDSETANLDVAAANLTLMPEEATRRAAGLLGKELSSNAEQETRTRTAVPAAYEAYLRGEGHLWQRQNGQHLDAAVDAFKQSVEADSTFGRAHAGLCRSYWYRHESSQGAGSREKAEHHCNRALAINEQLVSAHAGHGVLLRGTDRHDAAVSAFRKALALAPERADLYDELAATYVEQGHLKKAEATYNTVVYRWPDYWVGYNALGVFYQDQGEFEAAATQFRQAVKVAPNHFRPVNNLAVLYSRLGQLEKAEAMFERLIELRPNPVAYSNLGTIHFQEARYADAADAYESALSLKDDDYRLWGNLADALYWSGAREEATAHYRTAARMAEEKREENSSNPRLLCHLSGYYAKLDQPRKALSRLHAALEQAPNTPNVLFFAATTNAQLGRHRDALKWTERALDRGIPPEHIEEAVGLRSLRGDSRFKQMIKQAQSTP